MKNIAKVINLISGPRNISTALMYSFAQRTDTTVFDEPFYAVYLSKSDAEHPGKDLVLTAQSPSEPEVRSLVENSTDCSVVFVKNMAHHMEVLSSPWIKGAINVFLIRDPKQIIASYAEVIDTPVMRDIGIEYQHQLFETLIERQENFIVVDAGLLLQDPAKVLDKLCNRCAIGFDPKMLTWPAGPKSYDGIWAPFWYDNVHRSTGFQKQQTSSRPLPSHLEELYAQAKRYYEKLLPFSLKA
jgi:hypothetical protein